MTIRCSHCRAENPDDSLYCAKCGWQLLPPENDWLESRATVAPPAGSKENQEPESQEVLIPAGDVVEPALEPTLPIEPEAIREPAPPTPDVPPPPEPELTIVDGAAVFGERTYPLSEILSVSTSTDRANRLPSMLLAIFGIVILAVGLGILPRELILGILLGFGGFVIAALGVLLTVTARTQHILCLETKTGTEEALVSSDGALVNSMADRLQMAMREHLG
jgi:hypothetical protein